MANGVVQIDTPQNYVVESERLQMIINIDKLVSSETRKSNRTKFQKLKLADTPPASARIYWKFVKMCTNARINVD